MGHGTGHSAGRTSESAGKRRVERGALAAIALLLLACGGGGCGAPKGSEPVASHDAAAEEPNLGATSGRAAEPSDGDAVASGGDPLGELPDDLTIDVTVLPGWDLRFESVAHLVRSRAIVFPDGSLHADAGPTMDYLTRPGLARTLTREQMADLWLLLRQTGFAATEGGFLGNPAFLGPSKGELLTIVGITAHETLTVFVRRAPTGAADEATTRLVRALARLAWASDEPPEEIAIMPVRYDLGANPYARFQPLRIWPPLPAPRSSVSPRPAVAPPPSGPRR